MIYTARQLEQLQKAHGRVILPLDARLTPLATDWLRARKLSIAWADVPSAQPAAAPPATPPVPSPVGSAPPGGLLWWCDGPCGQAKAALSGFERPAGLRPLGVNPSEPATIDAIRAVAADLRDRRAQGAILLVRSAGAAMVFANRCPSIRAVLGTCLDAVDQAAGTVNANVLILEYPYKTFSQLRTLIGRFVRGPFDAPEAVRRQLQEIASCG
jgi:ribose 5-phosphate isomerase RpiB